MDKHMTRALSNLNKHHDTKRVHDDPIKLIFFSAFMVALQEFVGNDMTRSIDAIVWLADPATSELMEMLGYRVDLIYFLTTPGLDRHGMVMNARLTDG